MHPIIKKDRTGWGKMTITKRWWHNDNLFFNCQIDKTGYMLVINKTTGMVDIYYKLVVGISDNNNDHRL
jgi:hypothetical protein